MSDIDHAEGDEGVGAPTPDEIYEPDRADEVLVEAPGGDDEIGAPSPEDTPIDAPADELPAPGPSKESGEI